MRHQTYTPRTAPAQLTNSAAPTMSLPSLQSEGAQGEPKLVLMTRAEWKATPRDYKISSRKTGRFVMRHSPHGIGLFPVQIVD
ncbi:MAG: hypothetical protein KGM96_12345 [Acidobacteriota bacterium]|jgi:hypothetical protein|nr:hypothetical protein [Acidobacteriota bacterium]